MNLNSHETADETLPKEDTPSSSENQLEDPGDVSDTPSSSGNQLEDPGDVSFNSDGNIYFFFPSHHPPYPRLTTVKLVSIHVANSFYEFIAYNLF